MSINNDGESVPGDSVNPNQGQAPDPSPKNPRNPWIAVAIATAAVVCIGGLGTAAVAELTAGSTSHSASSSAATAPRTTFGQNGGNRRYDPFQVGGEAIGQQATVGEAAAVAATAAQQVGVVTIETTLDYDTDQQAAGTGMILSSEGYILTNNHVIDGSTSIRVTVESTGRSYAAVVVGSDSTQDVAVLKLTGASGLTPVSFAPTEKVAVGQSIYSVGNAEGTGHLVTAVGTVGAVNQTLTIGSDDSNSTERLSGMIQLQSDVVSGDSGGPLFDTKGKVIGMVTAASSGTNPVTGDAINIASVLKVADEIRSGTTSSEIVYGTPAFLGVSIASTTSVGGIPVASTFPGFPAAAIGLVEGDVITAVNGVAVTTATELSTDIRSYSVGSRVTIAWLDASGAAHSAAVTLVAGPAS